MTPHSPAAKSGAQPKKRRLSLHINFTIPAVVAFCAGCWWLIWLGVER